MIKLSNMDNENSNHSQLDKQTPDVAAIAIKSVLGAAPFIGTLLVEVVSAIIPNQRLDRVVKFSG